jgi:menaquinone-dependent protoporphyrinogen oxidase
VRILILHGSFDGQTRRIAERIAQVIERGRHQVRILPVQEGLVGRDIVWADAVIIGGAIRYGRHQRPLEVAVRENRALLEQKPNAFFSVCMSAAGPNAKPAIAHGYIDAFIQRTGWQPRQVGSFAGALQWSKYNLLIRLMMRIIVGMAGGDTDTSRDHEYTDWAAVERFAADFELPLREPWAA